jgi:hypothetical protein
MVGNRDLDSRLDPLASLDTGCPMDSQETRWILNHRLLRL